jgi:glycoprotein 6-alpha-L-fucosyltransferase
VYETDPAFSGADDLSRYPWHSAVRTQNDPRALYGTAWAQNFMREYQNPKSCEGKKYLSFRHDLSGMGSNLHAFGQALALAIHLGRILVVYGHDPQMIWLDGNSCPGQESWECWFLPLSHCKPHNAGDVMIVGMAQLSFSEAFNIHSVPSAFHELLQCSPVKDAIFWFYWWRAQSIAYIVRFNQHTRSMMNQMRAQVLHSVHGMQDKLHGADALPAGTIAAHVRHGDKGKEAKLFPFEDYHRQFERLASGDQTIPVLYAEVAQSKETFTYPRKKFEGRTMFISTEDQAAIDQAKMKTQGDHSWTVFHCAIDRPNVDVYTQRARKGVQKEVLEAFVNLELALEADAFVCTLSSNWCRLIDELRMTVGGKAGAPYINLATGGYPAGTPCLKDRPFCYLDW